MASPKQTGAVVVAALLLAAQARAALVVGPDGKSIRPGTGPVRLVGEVRDGACKVPPPDKRAVRFNLAPETKLEDLVAWIASVTCKSFYVRDKMIAEHGPVKVIAPD